MAWKTTTLLLGLALLTACSDDGPGVFRRPEATPANTSDTTADGTHDLPAVDDTTPTTLPSTGLDGDIVLNDDGLGSAHFGDDAEEAIAYLIGKLGLPTFDSGWSLATDYAAAICTSSEFREVFWLNLMVYFADEGLKSTGRQLVAYSYTQSEQNGGLLNPPLADERGLVLGDSLNRLSTLYPSAVVSQDGPGWWVYDTSDPATYQGPFGLLTTDANGSAAAVMSIGAGREPCAG